MYKKLILILTLVGIFSCSKEVTHTTQKITMDKKVKKVKPKDSVMSFTPIYDTLFDERDSNYYQVVLIGDTWWMTEDLRYKPYKEIGLNDSLKIIEGVEEYDKIFYGKYDSICPKGWSIPTERDWQKLFEYGNVKYDRGKFSSDSRFSSIYAMKVKQQFSLQYIIEKRFGGENSMGINLGFYGHVQEDKSYRKNTFTFSGFKSIGLYGFKNKKGDIYNVMLYSTENTHKYYEYHGTNNPVLIRAIKKKVFPPSDTLNGDYRLRVSPNQFYGRTNVYLTINNPNLIGQAFRCSLINSEDKTIETFSFSIVQTGERYFPLTHLETLPSGVYTVKIFNNAGEVASVECETDY